MANTFSKSDTLIAKGLAILFMLFHHVFNTIEYCELCSPFIFLGDGPLVHYLVFATNPVQFYCFLGGYGLFISKKVDGKRILKLYIHYWITLCIFIPLVFLLLIKPFIQVLLQISLTTLQDYPLPGIINVGFSYLIAF